MIDVNLLKYPEQLAARLSQMEREIENNKRKIARLEKELHNG